MMNSRRSQDQSRTKSHPGICTKTADPRMDRGDCRSCVASGGRSCGSAPLFSSVADGCSMRRIDRGGRKNVCFQPFRSRAACRPRGLQPPLQILRAFGSVGLWVTNSKKGGQAGTCSAASCWLHQQYVSTFVEHMRPSRPASRSRFRLVWAPSLAVRGQTPQRTSSAHSGHVYRRPGTRLRMAGRPLPAWGRRRP